MLAGIADARVWDSETILRLDRMPETLLVLGGGYVGCEFASIFAMFGARVILIQGADQLLPREDPDVAQDVETVLRGLGVDVRLGARARAVRRERDRGRVVLVLDDGSELRADEMLAATGRTPETADLGLDRTGVALDGRGFRAARGYRRHRERPGREWRWPG